MTLLPAAFRLMTGVQVWNVKGSVSVTKPVDQVSVDCAPVYGVVTLMLKEISLPPRSWMLV